MTKRTPHQSKARRKPPRASELANVVFKGASIRRPPPKPIHGTTARRNRARTNPATSAEEALAHGGTWGLAQILETHAYGRSGHAAIDVRDTMLEVARLLRTVRNVKPPGRPGRPSKGVSKAHSRWGTEDEGRPTDAELALATAIVGFEIRSAIDEGALGNIADEAIALAMALFSVFRCRTWNGFLVVPVPALRADAEQQVTVLLDQVEAKLKSMPWLAGKFQHGWSSIRRSGKRRWRGWLRQTVASRCSVSLDALARITPSLARPESIGRLLPNGLFLHRELPQT